MFPINSLSGGLAQSAQIQIQQAAEKSRQARKAKDEARSADGLDDELEHQVENAEEVTAIHEDGGSSQRRRKKQQHEQEDDSPDSETGDGLDLQA